MSIDLGLLQSVDFPKVQFWYLDDWTRARKPITGPMQYIQDREGRVVDEIAIFAMRGLAQSIWSELGVSGAAASTWRQVDMESKKHYYRAMAAGFFNLRLCDENWKAEQIAMDNYSLWVLRWCPGQADSDQLKRGRNLPTTRKAGPSTSGNKTRRPKVNLRSTASVSSNVHFFFPKLVLIVYPRCCQEISLIMAMFLLKEP